MKLLRILPLLALTTAAHAHPGHGPELLRAYPTHLLVHPGQLILVLLASALVVRFASAKWARWTAGGAFAAALALLLTSPA